MFTLKNKVKKLKTSTELLYLVVFMPESYYIVH